MATCPTCGTESPADVRFCPKDGTALSPGATSPGSMIGVMVERYRIIGRVGEGGMGMVYRAEHTHLARQVALKLLHPEMARNRAVLDRFFREARAASEVKSPHIVEVIDFGTTGDGQSFLVMELLDGLSLRELLDREEERRLPPARVVAIARQIASGLAAAHARGVVHRDLKPANIILIGRDGNPDFVKILDFGIAKLNDKSGAQLTQTGMIIGSPTYMSPEQAAGKPVDARTDLYSLGVILYEMLVGTAPFRNEDPAAVVMSQLYEQPDPPRARRPDVPEPLEALILRCLAKKPEERPADLESVDAALRAWEEGHDQDLLEVSRADATLAARPVAIAASRVTADVTGPGAPPGLRTLSARPAEVTGPVQPRRRTSIVLVAAVLGVVAGIAITLKLLGSSPEALLGPLTARLRGADAGAAGASLSQPAVEAQVDRGVGPAPARDLARPDIAAVATSGAPVDAGKPAGDAGTIAEEDDLELEDDDETGTGEEEAAASAPPSSTPAATPGVSKAGKKVTVAKKKVRPRLTRQQLARRKALKARLLAEHARLQKQLRAHRISKAQYRKAVTRLKQRYRRALR